MKCPYCLGTQTRVIDTREDNAGNVRRRRRCLTCGKRFTTIERAVITTPMVIKRDGRREPFDREKILSGLRIACARRPISADELERLVDRVEYTIRQRGRSEVKSKLIGDAILDELRGIDEVAYIRYAIVYLGLRDLEAVRREIDRIRSLHR